jgi:myo-inositol-1(or 4)-monophosphatase
MQPTTSLLINSTKKSSKLLQRDLFELELLQVSNRSTSEFCAKSYSRTKSLLQTELQRNYQYLFFADEKVELPVTADNILLIQPIDSIINLSKSLPFFATMITYLKRINDAFTPMNSIMTFPALSEIYFAEHGRGAWLEKNDLNSFGKNSRLRVSACSSLDKAMIAVDDIAHYPDSLKNTRLFGSPCYNIALFTGGKFDAVYSSHSNDILRLGFELFIKESGGSIVKNDNLFVASNQTLVNKFKQLI